MSPVSKCNICCRPVNAPYRRIVDGKIVEGCIAEDHEGHLPVPSNSFAWHNRPVAKKHRAETRRHLVELLK